MAYLSRLGSFSEEKSNSRFSLLFLEDGEYYLEDYSVYHYQDPKTTSLSFDKCWESRQQGRLKVCTRSLMFEPNDSNIPITKYRFKHMPQPPSQWRPLRGTGGERGDTTLFFSFSCLETTEILKGNRVGPYDHQKHEPSSLPSFIFSLLHTQLGDVLQLLDQLWDLANISKSLNKIDEEAVFSPILSTRRTETFDRTVLVDFRERPLSSKAKAADRITPLLKHPGTILLTNQRIYFQPAQLNNSGGDPVLKYQYAEIEHIYRRRHMLRQNGLEIYLKKGGSIFFAFKTRKDRDEIFTLIINQPGLTRLQETDHSTVMARWQRGELSNFEYLMYLNNEADRTANDLTQYPVMPWVLADYDSQELDLNNPKTFRDLSKPIGALNPARLEYFKERFASMPPEDPEMGCPPPFLYGTHYSTPGYVLYYIVRKAPEYMLCLQNGRFDAPDRMFNSIQETWTSVLNNNADLKELIPEFYSTEEPAASWLTNQQRLDMGVRQKTGKRVQDVELPAWAEDPEDFVRKMRQALESDYVSDHLHHWIDLIFGYKQKGEEAIKADNLFYFLTYEGSVDLEQISDPVQRTSYEAQISEFGQTPKQLFDCPHPPRRNMGESITKLSTEDECLKQPGETSLLLHNLPTIPEPTRNRPVDSVIPLAPPPTAGPRSLWPWERINRTSFDCSPPYKLHKKALTSLLVHHTEPSLVLSSSEDGTVKVCSRLNGRQQRNFTCELAASSLALSADGSTLFVGCWDDKLYLFSTSTGKVIEKFRAHDDAVSAVAAYKDRVITASWDSTVKVWKYSGGGVEKAPLIIFSDMESSIQSLALTSDGRYLAAGCEEGAIAIYNLTNGATEHFLEASATGELITGLCWSADDSLLFSCSVDNVLSVFSTSGQRLASAELDVEGELRCVRSDGRFILIGGSDGALRFWEYSGDRGQQGELKEMFVLANAHATSITALHVLPSGRSFFTGCHDGTMRMWSLT